MATTFAIACLSPDQSQMLEGVKVGDFILFQKQYTHPPPTDESDSDSEENSDEDDSDRDEDDSEEEEDDVSETAESHDEEQYFTAGEDEVNEVEIAATVSTNPTNGGEQDAAPAHSNGSSASIEQDAATGSRGSSAVDDTSSGNQQSEDDTYPTSEEETGEQDTISTQDLFRVVAVRKAGDADDGAIEDLQLSQLEYHASHQCLHTFRVYGTEVHVTAGSDATCNDDVFECNGGKAESLKDLAEQGSLAGYGILLNPSGDFVRRIVSPHEVCPIEQCNEGFLDSLNDLPTILHRDIYTSPALLEHRPVCPVCMGLDLLKEHQDLRSTLDAVNMVDIGECIEYHGRLNTRRRALRYSFQQYDEREWGMYFDDMQSEDEDDDGDGGNDGGQWQNWAEAMDPSACVVLRPATQATIDALPRKLFGEAKYEIPGELEEGEQHVCLVCREEFKEETVVAQLPCKHVFCDQGCVEQWLKQFNNCPVCRAAVPNVEVIDGVDPQESGQSAAADGQAEMAGGEGLGTAQGGIAASEEKDGEDAVMSDI